MGNLEKNWPVYVLMAGFIWLIVYTFINSHKEEKKKYEEEKGKQGKGA